jgi:hypothetical protein
MNQHILELMRQADYAAPEMAKRAQVLADMVINDCIQTLINNGYTDAAKCLRDVNFGIDDAP